MLNTAYTVLWQVLTLFILMAVGFIITKAKMLNAAGNKQITAILVNIVTPCVVLHAFVDNFSNIEISGLILSFALAALTHVVGIIISMFFFGGQPDKDRGVLRSAMVYSNCGFMGLPLIGAVLGSEGLIYGAVYVAVFNAFAWTLGLWSVSGSKNMNPIKLILNPGTIGIALALPVVIFGITLPAPVEQSVGFLANLNTPLAMIVIGFHMANTKIFKSLTDWRIYIVGLFRLILIPLLLFSVLWFIDCDIILKKALILAASAPTAATCTLIVAKCNANTDLSSKCVAFTTLFSIITMPAIYTFISYFM